MSSPTKLAFSTVACPGWELDTIIARAREYGYDGVELRGYRGEKAQTAFDLFAVEATAVRERFSTCGIEIACLSNSIAMSGKAKVDLTAADSIRSYIDLAKTLGCPYVKMADVSTRRGDRQTKAVAMADWLLPLGDYAADRDVTLLIENEFFFRTAGDLWLLLEMMNHPAVSACWDVCNAAVVGERPAVSVPGLNRRIQYVHIRDATITKESTAYRPIGEGDVPVRDLLIRLRGIGYAGWVTVEWEKATLPELAGPEDFLPQAAKTLRDYLKPHVNEKGTRSVAKTAAVK